MNKKIVTSIIVVLIIIIGVFIYFLVSNSNNSNSSLEYEANEILNNSQDDENNNISSDEKILIAYFSRAGENYNVGNVDIGNTAMMASYMVDYLDDNYEVDTYEIIPVNKYSDDYDEATEQAQAEQSENARPEIENSLNNIDDYDTIFIGYPIWWSDMPMIVYTFLESYDFSGKTVIPFNTHEGSGDSGTYEEIRDKLSSANVNINGLAIRGSVARTEEGRSQTVSWLEGLGY